jgi:hypothetical protein
VTPAADQALAQLCGRRLSRRELLRGTGTGAVALGLAALAAACSRQPSTPQAGAAPAGSLAALKQNVQQLSFLGAQSQLVVGRNLLTFGLSTPDNKLVTGGTPQVWVGTDDTAKAQGPYPAGWSALSAYERTKDNAPRSALTGFYAAAVDFPAPGNWILVATTHEGCDQAGAPLPQVGLPDRAVDDRDRPSRHHPGPHRGSRRGRPGPRGAAAAAGLTMTISSPSHATPRLL